MDFRKFWLYEPKVPNKGFVIYAREITNEEHDRFWPQMASPWTKKLPPIKVVEISALEEKDRKIAELEAQIEHLKVRERNAVLMKEAWQIAHPIFVEEFNKLKQKLGDEYEF